MNPSNVIQPEDLPESLLEKDAPPGIVEDRYHAALKEANRHLT
jgi:hypothetical protein